MNFNSHWITTEDFKNLTSPDMYYREYEEVEILESPYKNYHVHFRKTFFLENTENMYINISADDYYKLYINGKFVCMGPASAYPDSYNYNSVNISPYVQNGDNIIAVHVFYHGYINRAYFSGDNRMGLVADVYYGNSFLFGTDETWKYKKAEEFSGQTVGYETLFLENIDFNLKDVTFKDLYIDESSYKSAVVKSNDDYIFRNSPVPTVDVYSVKPESVVRIEEGKYFVDFGTELSGGLCMKIRGFKGQKVRILCGEELSDNPMYVRHEMRCNCNYDETLILSGAEDEVEFYDYKAFRYVNIFTDSDFDTASISATVRHHKFDVKTTVRSDIPYIEDIWNICKNGVKCCAQESLLDCITREKGAYLGDYTVSGLSHYYLTGDKEYFKKNLYDYAYTSRISKALMAVANSSLMQEFADYSLQYPMQVLNYLKLTRDKETARDLYPVIEGILSEFAKYEREDGLLDNVSDIANLVDWPQNLRDGYDADIDRDSVRIDCHNVLNAFYIGAHKATEELAQMLGINRNKRSAELSIAYIQAFYNPETNLFSDTEEHTHSALHSNALPLYFGIALPEMYDSVKNFIMKKGLSCGVYMSYFVLKGLGRINAYEEELSLLINDGEHSWVNMLREGAASCFEAWGKEQKWNTSLCHPWASCPIIIICEDLADKQFESGTISVIKQ